MASSVIPESSTDNPGESSDATAASTSTQFHVTLCVADLFRSVRFYQTLFGRPPSMQHGNYARFELERPALVLILYATQRPPGGALSHVGLRVGTSAELVELQQRLESSGIATQSQEGVECCYARQTKFWATDPDGVLWELYILEEDIEHSGFDDHPSAKQEPAPQSVWMHRLTEPVPETIPAADGSLDEVRLEGTYNVKLEAVRRAAFLAEIKRALRPGGKVVVHGLVSDRPFPGEPKLPGLASLVQFVPMEIEIENELRQAGFEALFYKTLSDVNCISAAGVDLRHGLLEGLRPSEKSEPKNCQVLYRGPMAQVRDEQGTVFPRGQSVAVTATTADRLRKGPAADQFAFLASPPPPVDSLFNIL